MTPESATNVELAEAVSVQRGLEKKVGAFRPKRQDLEQEALRLKQDIAAESEAAAAGDSEAHQRLDGLEARQHAVQRELDGVESAESKLEEAFRAASRKVHDLNRSAAEEANQAEARRLGARLNEIARHREELFRSILEAEEDWAETATELNYKFALFGGPLLFDQARQLSEALGVKRQAWYQEARAKGRASRAARGSHI